MKSVCCGIEFTPHTQDTLLTDICGKCGKADCEARLEVAIEALKNIGAFTHDKPCALGSVELGELEAFCQTCYAREALRKLGEET